jgi:hypothetical protein
VPSPDALGDTRADGVLLNLCTLRRVLGKKRDAGAARQPASVLQLQPAGAWRSLQAESKQRKHAQELQSTADAYAEHRDA